MNDVMCAFNKEMILFSIKFIFGHLVALHLDVN